MGRCHICYNLPHMNKKKTIFLVDDDEDDLFLMGEVISDLKMEINVLYAHNGQELLGMLKNEIKDALILIDMNMPMMNGIETLRALYADPSLTHLPSILLSTSDSEQLKKSALEAGAMQFICKPFQYQEYLKLMKEIYQSF